MSQQVIVRPGAVGPEGRVEMVDVRTLEPAVPGIETGQVKVRDSHGLMCGAAGLKHV